MLAVPLTFHESCTLLATSAPFCPTHLRNEEGKKKRERGGASAFRSLPECPHAYVEESVLIFVKGDDFAFSDEWRI